MAEYKIADYSVRMWSSREIADTISPGAALEACYLFDSQGQHRGTISFYPDALERLLDGALLAQWPALQRVDRIELRRFYWQRGEIMEALAQCRTADVSIFCNSAPDAGLSVTAAQ